VTEELVIWNMQIKREVIDAIHAQAVEKAPIEACGFLMGLQGRITRRYPMINAEAREDHFTFDPNEHITALKVAKEEGLDIIGMYHSHPATPARPSAEDIRLAHYPAIIYVITSLLDGAVTTKGFYIREGIVEEEPLLIEDS
jgi:[CysO sulfur-carrier protein]-S-L-cysteine hydrolase